jgi:hypothetical protein
MPITMTIGDTDDKPFRHPPEPPTVGGAICIDYALQRDHRYLVSQGKAPVSRDTIRRAMRNLRERGGANT